MQTRPRYAPEFGKIRYSEVESTFSSVIELDVFLERKEKGSKVTC